MTLAYLEGNIIDQTVLDAREGGDFSVATSDARQRDRDHPDEINARYDIVSDPEMLQGVMKGYRLFQELWTWPFNLKNFGLFLDALSQSFPKNSHFLTINETEKSVLKERIRSTLWNQVDELDLDQIIAKWATLIQLWRALSIDNKNTQSSSLVINGGPVVEMEQRVQDSIEMILSSKPNIIILSWWSTDNVVGTGTLTEAEYLEREIWSWFHGTSERPNFTLENIARNTGENMTRVGEMLRNSHDTTIVTTDYDSLRVLLTAQKQMPYSWWKRVHGSKFEYTEKDSSKTIVWSPYTWWLTENGWLATMYAMSRLVKYRARTNPFL